MKRNEYISDEVVVRRANAAVKIELEKKKAQREEHIDQMSEFCFETVLSTERNLRLLEKAKEKGYFIRCYYILTADPAINIWRVKSRVESGGHDVPEEKIILRIQMCI